MSIRMEATLKLSKPANFLNRPKRLPTIGGFEMKANGTIYQFDFEDGAYFLDDDGETISCLLKNPDTAEFEDLEAFIDGRHYTDIEEIIDFYIEDDEIEGLEDVEITVVDAAFIEMDVEDNGKFINWDKWPISPEIIAKHNKEKFSSTPHHNTALTLIPEELAYQVGELYFAIHEIEDGYDYSIYDKNFAVLDGGVYDDPSKPIHTVINRIVEDDPVTGIIALLDRNNAMLLDYSKFMDEVEG